MAEVVASKLKLLHLTRIFMEETDDEHGLSTPQLIQKLAELDISVERKTLYRDIECLRSFGFDIIKYDRRPTQYGLASRVFQEQELMLLADAVQSSRFLTKKKSDALVDSISKLGSRYMADGLKKRIHIEGRVKSQKESEFYDIDTIQRAFDAKKKIEFKYLKYDENKKLVPQKDNRTYVETPVQLMYMDDQYYLISWNDAHEDFTTYRVDRMQSIELSSTDATRNEKIANFDVAQYQQRVFGMFKGRVTRATLRVSAEVMNSVIDRFGKDVTSTSTGDGYAKVTVDVMDAPTFYGWLATFGSNISIESPSSLRQSYLDHLQSIITGYQQN